MNTEQQPMPTNLAEGAWCWVRFGDDGLDSPTGWMPARRDGNCMESPGWRTPNVLAYGPQITIGNTAIHPDHEDHVQEIAIRLRRVARAAGRPNCVPDDDTLAVGAIFTVLGSIAGALESARTQPTPPNQWQKPETKPPLDARMKRSAVCYIAKLDGTVAQAIYDPYYDREFSDGRGGLVRWPGWIEILPSACHTGQYMEEPIVAWMSIQEVPAHPLSAELGEFADSSAQVIATPPAQPAPVVPEGHKLVPIEPTQAMLDAVVSTVDEMLLGQAAERQYREDWAAMLAAAPQPLPLHNTEVSGPNGSA